MRDSSVLSKHVDRRIKLAAGVALSQRGILVEEVGLLLCLCTRASERTRN